MEAENTINGCNQSEARQPLVSTLKTYSLSYQQHQMLKGDGAGLLASSIVAKRARFSYLLAAITSVFALQVVRGVISSSDYTPWAIMLGISGAWMLRRYRKTSVLKRALESFQAVESEEHVDPDSLADQLRLGFKLDYAEHQAIHAGKERLAANKLIDRHLASTKSSAEWSMLLFALAGFSWFGLPIYFRVHAIQNTIPLFLLTVFLAICMTAVAISNKIIARRAESLLDEHDLELSLDRQPSTTVDRTDSFEPK